MPMIDLTPRLRELGRIRTGNQVATQSGKRRPNKLDTFRITTPSEALAKAVQAAYDGKVEPWESPAGKQFEVITRADSLPIIIPAGEALSQWYEMWSGGGCQRRCDGRTEMLSDSPCLCPSDATARRDLAAKTVPEACKPTTRLNVVLPDVPDLGVWRLESHGYYAAVELAGAALFLSAAMSRGMNIPAHLRLEQREKKVPGQPINRYAVPVIEFGVRISDLLDAGAGPMMLGEGIAPPQQLAPGSLLPAKAERAPRQPRVDRPALGPAPTVPNGSGFGRRQPVAPTTAPSLTAGAVHDEPESVAGFVIDDQPATDAPGAADTAAPVPTSTTAENAPAAAAAEPTDDGDAAPAGLTRDELVQELRAIGVSTGAAAERSKAMWPDRGTTPLTDAQRAELLVALRSETVAASL